jgi:nucleotide-binding universal stress UspA family protein
MATFRRILVATDYGPSSERALEAAVAFATRFGAELVVLHVIEENAFAYPFPIPKAAREAAKSRLDETVAGLRARMLNASGILREGVAWNGVCESAAEVSADLVVVGSQGRHGLPRFVLGSVARTLRSPVAGPSAHGSFIGLCGDPRRRDGSLSAYPRPDRFQ